MPNKNPATLERERLLKPLLRFITTLPNRLQSLCSTQPDESKDAENTSTASIDASLVSELQSHINTLRSNGSLLFSSESSKKVEELDRRGTELWNLGTRLKRELEITERGPQSANIDVYRPESPKLKILVLLRVLVFLFLDSVAQVARSATGAAKKAAALWWKSHVRLLRVANKVAKSCLESAQLEYCTKVLERAADYQDAMGKFVEGRNRNDELEEREGQSRIFAVLRVEFFVLRMTLAWKQNNLQLADLMLTQALGGDVSSIDPPSLEALADALFEIGKDLFRKTDFYQSSKWLEKAFDAIAAQGLELLSSDAGELKLSILHYLVRALLGLNNDESRKRARNLLALMEADSPGRTVVSLLHLDIIDSEKDFDAELYYNVVNRIIRMMHLTGPNFKNVVNRINKLKEHNPEMACKAIDDLLNLRLYAHDSEEWIQRCFITRLWITIDKLPGLPSVLESLQECIASMARVLRTGLSANATHAAQTLIWKRIDTLFHQENYEAARAWCQLALHEIFVNAGENNTAKINRKMLLCQIHRAEYASARSTFNQMSETARAAPMTRFIMFKLAIRDRDSALAAECIEIISKSQSKDQTLLYACVVEARSSGDKHQAIAALQTVLAKYDSADAPAGVHLPSLIRCTAKLLVSEIQDNGHEDSNVPEEICKLFEGAALAAKRAAASKGKEVNPFDQRELDWFVTTSYNLGLKYYGEWLPRIVTRLLETCIQFSEHQDAKRESNGDTPPAKHIAICHSLVAQQLVRFARAEDSQATQLQYYLNVRKHIRSFQQRFERAAANNYEADYLDNTTKISRKLSIIDFECAIHLKTWDDLTKIMDDCKRINGSASYEIYADMIMGSEAPPSVTIHTLEHMTTLSNDSANPEPIAVQARRLRILYQLSLTHPSATSPSASAAPHPSKTDAILAQVLTLARSLNATTDRYAQHKQDQHHRHHHSNRQQNSQQQEQQQQQTYPAEELEYLATSTFNRAIDAYCASDEPAARALGERALELAQELGVSDDGGRLRGLLMQRLAGLFGMGSGMESAV